LLKNGKLFAQKFAQIVFSALVQTSRYYICALEMIR
jgi:hypothetical protein